jgi:hypothetical protein
MLEQSTLMFNITFVWKQVENGEVMFEYCSMEDTVPNVFTKALSKER